MAIQLPPNSTGTIVDTVTLAAKDREIHVIGGDDAAAEVADVKNTSPSATAYGLTVRPILRKDAQTLSTTALGVSGEFAQAFQDGATDGIVFVEASARADVASATDGFKVEESDDTASADFTVATVQVTVSANTTTSIRAIIRRRYWRIKYTNGGTAQTSFRLTLSAVQQPLAEQSADFDTTGTQVQPVSLEGIALPGAGGPVIGGTSTNPLRTDPTGTTTQPVSGTVTANQGTPAATANRWPVQITDGTDLALVTAAGAVQVDGSAVTQPVSIAAAVDVSDRAARLVGQVEGRAADGIAVAGNPVRIAGKDGGGLTQDIATDAAGELQVDVLTLPANASMNLAQVAGTATVTGGTAGSQGVAGLQARDAAISGQNPVVVGGRASAADPTAVSADGDVVDAWLDLFGRFIIVKNFPAIAPSDTAGAGAHGPKTVTLTATTDTALVAAPGAGLSTYVTGVSGSNTSATLTRLDLKDGTTTRYSMALAASGGGYVEHWDPPWKITANTAFNGALGTAVTDVRVNIHYYTAP